jgi:importin-4
MIHTCQSVLRIIDGLCTHLPPSQVWPTLERLIGEYLQSPEAANRRGAVLTLGIAVEGCSEYITPRLNLIWPALDNSLRDPDVSVRKAACVGVSCFTEWLEDECAARHAVFIPVSGDRFFLMKRLIML